MISKTLRLNMAKDDVENDKRQIGMLFALPKGSKVIVFVGNRQYWNAHAVSLLNEYLFTHHIEIEGYTPEVCTNWEKGILENPFGRRRSS